MMSNIARYAAAVALAVAPVGLWAQAAPAAAAAATPTAAVLPLAGLHYRYWTKQIVEWIGPELPYSMIVLNVDDRGKQPIYDVELMDKSGKATVHYTNSAAELALDKRLGFNVYQVAMQLDGPADPVNGSQYMLRFNTEKGVPVVWQFLLGTDVTEQGSGVNPIAAGPVSLLIYRELGGLAAQGTAVQIGGVTSTAAEWSEIAQPPYFVPYRGALSSGAHVLVFTPEPQMWTAGPKGLTDKAGDVLSVTKSGDAVVMTDAALGVSADYTLGANNAVSRVTFGPVGAKSNHTVSVEFTPALAPGAESKFEVLAGKKTKIAEGSVKEAADGSETWTFTKPDALRKK